VITSRYAPGKGAEAASPLPFGHGRPTRPQLVSDPRLTSLRHALSRHTAWRAAPAEGVRAAAVALVLRPAGPEMELLLIKRAERAGDPWSGHMAFPGGRRDPEDRDAVATAVRETREEVGIALGEPMGALDEVAPGGGTVRMVVSPYVFAVGPEVVAVPNHEVEAAVWIPLRELAHPGVATEHLLETVTGTARRFPAIGTRGYVIWGMTHRILSDFLRLAAEVLDLEGEP